MKKYISMLCPVHEENTPSFCYEKKTGKFYCFGCGFKGNLFEMHQKKILSLEILNYIYSHIQPESQNCGDALSAVEWCMDFNPMLCHDCWIPALLDRGKKIQCQNCGLEYERMDPSLDSHNKFRTMVDKTYRDRLRPFIWR